MLSFQGAWQQMAKTGRADQVRIVRPVELTARQKDLWDLNKLFTIDINIHREGPLFNPHRSSSVPFVSSSDA